MIICLMAFTIKGKTKAAAAFVLLGARILDILQTSIEISLRQNYIFLTTTTLDDT